MGSRTGGSQEKGTVRERDRAADADRDRQKDSERDKEIQSHCSTKEKGEQERRKEKDAGGEGDRETEQGEGLSRIYSIKVSMDFLKEHQDIPITELCCLLQLHSCQGTFLPPLLSAVFIK